MTLIPFAPARRACVIAFFIARRNDTRFTSWAAMFSATSCASASTFRTSMMLRKISVSVSFCRSDRNASRPAARLPMMMPGLAAYTYTFALFAARSIVTLLIEAWKSFSFRNFRIARSSWRNRW